MTSANCCVLTPRRFLPLIVASLALFGILAEAVVSQRRVTVLDATVAEAAHRHGQEHPTLWTAARILTDVGSTWGLVILLGTVVLALLVKDHGKLAGGVMLVALVNGLLVKGLKEVFGRQRPFFDDAIYQESSLSFPSGHTMGSLVCFGLVAYLLAATGTPKRRQVPLLLGLGLLVLGIAASRVYLAVHYVSDVLAGLSGGLAVLTVGVLGLERLRHGEA